MTGNDIDLVRLDNAVQDHRRKLGCDAGAQLFGHRLHIGDGQIEFLGDLAIRQVQAHEVQAQHPNPQRLVMPGQHCAGQVIEAGATR